MEQRSLNAKEIIELAVQAGAKIISEKKEKSGTCEARNVELKKDTKYGLCHIKASYIELGEKVITVRSECHCNSCNTKSGVLEDCVKNQLSNM